LQGSADFTENINFVFFFQRPLQFQPAPGIVNFSERPGGVLPDDGLWVSMKQIYEHIDMLPACGIPSDDRCVAH
jgi:hypothetical protein